MTSKSDSMAKITIEESPLKSFLSSCYFEIRLKSSDQPHFDIAGLGKLRPLAGRIDSRRDDP